jgi:hypothetical protein
MGCLSRMVFFDGNYLSLSVIIGVFPSLLGDIKKGIETLFRNEKHFGFDSCKEDNDREKACDKLTGIYEELLSE